MFSKPENLKKVPPGSVTIVFSATVSVLVLRVLYVQSLSHCQH